MTTLQVSELNRLANEINEAHDQCEGAFKYTLNYAIVAGEKLIEAKSLNGHGNWQNWHENNVYHSIQRSRTYITIAENKQLLLQNERFLSFWTIEAAMKLIKGGKPMLQSNSREWYTPREYIDSVKEVLGEIDLDPASCEEAQETIQAKRYYTENDDGLSQPWFGKVFLNPPYGKMTSEFATKLYEEFGSSVQEAILLVNSRATDADWFQPCFEGVICFTDHRIDFDAPSEKTTSSTHGSCFVYFGKRSEKFARIFSKYGNIVKRWP